ncbi:hypothetical protein [Bacillus tropicus]|uniref:hypothetical protein n=1 Tax=Bacillus tropicus TaxID=2026188 RepID=UPI002DB782E0|nr:hypothetical protein [Bacillus tropicus]
MIPLKSSASHFFHFADSAGYPVLNGSSNSFSSVKRRFNSPALPNRYASVGIGRYSLMTFRSGLHAIDIPTPLLHPVTKKSIEPKFRSKPTLGTLGFSLTRILQL